MASMLDQLQQAGESLRSLLELDDPSLRAALAEGFHDQAPTFAANRSNDQWAAAILEWLSSMAPLLHNRLKLPAESTVSVVDIRGVHETLIIGDSHPFPPEDSQG